MTPEHGSKLDARFGTIIINQNEISIVERDTVAVHVNVQQMPGMKITENLILLNQLFHT